MLTSGNQKSSTTYINYVTEQVANHNLIQRMDSLIQKVTSPLHHFSKEDAIKLNKIVSQVTDNMLSSERLCSKHANQCQYWSPQLRSIAKAFSCWKQKATMAMKKLFLWDHLNRLCTYTNISDSEHEITDTYIIQKKRGRPEQNGTLVRNGV
jgi:hypothetical protein